MKPAASAGFFIGIEESRGFLKSAFSLVEPLVFCGRTKSYRALIWRWKLAWSWVRRSRLIHTKLIAGRAINPTTALFFIAL